MMQPGNDSASAIRRAVMVARGLGHDIGRLDRASGGAVSRALIHSFMRGGYADGGLPDYRLGEGGLEPGQDYGAPAYAAPQQGTLAQLLGTSNPTMGQVFGFQYPVQARRALQQAANAGPGAPAAAPGGGLPAPTAPRATSGGPTAAAGIGTGAISSPGVDSASPSPPGSDAVASPVSAPPSSSVAPLSAPPSSLAPIGVAADAPVAATAPTPSVTAAPIGSVGGIGSDAVAGGTASATPSSSPPGSSPTGALGVAMNAANNNSPGFQGMPSTPVSAPNSVVGLAPDGTATAAAPGEVSAPTAPAAPAPTGSGFGPNAVTQAMYGLTNAMLGPPAAPNVADQSNVDATFGVAPSMSPTSQSDAASSVGALGHAIGLTAAALGTGLNNGLAAVNGVPSNQQGIDAAVSEDAAAQAQADAVANFGDSGAQASADFGVAPISGMSPSSVAVSPDSGNVGVPSASDADNGMSPSAVSISAPSVSNSANFGGMSSDAVSAPVGTVSAPFGGLGPATGDFGGMSSDAVSAPVGVAEGVSSGDSGGVSDGSAGSGGPGGVGADGPGGDGPGGDGPGGSDSRGGYVKSARSRTVDRALRAARRHRRAAGGADTAEIDADPNSTYKSLYLAQHPPGMIYSTPAARGGVVDRALRIAKRR